MNYFQVGAVPVYFGAPNVRQWLPNDISVIHIDDFSDPSVLADFLLHLHHNENDYLAYLQHKQSYNWDKYPLINNDNLVQAMETRSWGVSDKDQIVKGNFVEKFECLVCSRVAQNMEMGQIGFKPMPYEATEDHYGCPSPVLETGGTLSNVKNRWWERQWIQAFYEGEILSRFLETKTLTFDKTTFYEQVLSAIKSDHYKLLNNSNGNTFS